MLGKPSEVEPASRLPALSNVFNNDVAILWGVILVAWVLTLLAAATGQEHLLHHNALIRDLQRNKIPAKWGQS